MSYVKGKHENGIREKLNGYEKTEKAKVTGPVKIEDVVISESTEGEKFGYVCGIMDGEKVCVSIPKLSLDDFASITENDILEIQRDGLKFYLECHVSKIGRTYYTAYIDD